MPGAKSTYGCNEGYVLKIDGKYMPEYNGKCLSDGTWQLPPNNIVCEVGDHKRHIFMLLLPNLLSNQGSFRTTKCNTVSPTFYVQPYPEGFVVGRGGGWCLLPPYNLAPLYTLSTIANAHTPLTSPPVHMATGQRCDRACQNRGLSCEVGTIIYAL